MTPKQKELLDFLRTNDSGVSPSYDEIKLALGLKSKSGVHRLVTALEERGYIRRLPHRARAIEVIVDDAPRLGENRKILAVVGAANRLVRSRAWAGDTIKVNESAFNYLRDKLRAL